MEARATTASGWLAGVLEGANLAGESLHGRRAGTRE